MTLNFLNATYFLVVKAQSPDTTSGVVWHSRTSQVQNSFSPRTMFGIPWTDCLSRSAFMNLQLASSTYDAIHPTGSVVEVTF